MRDSLKRVLILLTCLSLFNALGQSDSTSTSGEIIAGEIVIEKEKRIVLPKADKVYLRSEVIPFETVPLKQQFEIKSPEMKWPEYQANIPFKRVQPTKPVDLHQNYVKFGLGNDRSWLLERALFSKIGEWNTTANLFYERFGRGPVLSDNSGNSEGFVEISASRKIEGFTIRPELSYGGQGYNYYGNTDRSSIGFPIDAVDGSWGTFSTGVTLESEGKDFSFRVTPKFHYSNHDIDKNDQNSAERTFFINAVGSYRFLADLEANIEADLATTNYNGGIEYGRSIINLNPTISGQRGEFVYSLGFMLSSGSFDGSRNTSVYPTLDIALKVSDKWELFGLLDGRQQLYLLSEALSENSFLDDSLLLSNQEVRYHVRGGIKGKPVEKVSTEISISHESVNGLPFFVPSATDSSNYALTYDNESVGITRIEGTIEFSPSIRNRYGASLQFNAFSLGTIDEAWHRPAFVFSGHSSHTINQKFIFTTHFTAMGGIRSPSNLESGEEDLDSFLDLGLGAKYLFTNRASVFIDVNNLLNNEYERYLGYPIRGINFKIGAQYRF